MMSDLDTISFSISESLSVTAKINFYSPIQLHTHRIRNDGFITFDPQYHVGRYLLSISRGVYLYVDICIIGLKELLILLRTIEVNLNEGNRP